MHGRYSWVRRRAGAKGLKSSSAWRAATWAGAGLGGTQLSCRLRLRSGGSARAFRR
ncbi:hypothetical protein [Lysobacter gummosus]|uniref:hypothetical protein n=1 Tax=Lysobacter gummosus TaxID=262324 RepID=UPI00363D515F